MKNGQIAIAVVAGILATVAGTMAVTNPGQQEYEKYATEQLSFYLKEKICNEEIEDLPKFLRGQCKTLVDTINPQIKQLVAENTQRQNTLLFSIYRTQLALPAPLSGYNFETVGILQKFYTYEAEKI